MGDSIEKRYIHEDEYELCPNKKKKKVYIASGDLFKWVKKTQQSYHFSCLERPAFQIILARTGIEKHEEAGKKGIDFTCQSLTR